MAEEGGVSSWVINNLCQIFHILSNKTRLRIVLKLTRRPMGVSELCKALSLQQHTLSHHLGILWMSGIASRHREGKQVIYIVNKEVLETLSRDLVGHFGRKESGSQRMREGGCPVAEMPEVSSELVNNLCQIFHILSNRTRLRIVLRLTRRAMSVGALCEALSLPQHTVSHHLGILWMSGIASRHREGKQVIYVANKEVIETLSRQLVGHFGGEPAA